MSLTLLTVLVIFQIKHFIADYLLQNSYMLGKFAPKGWQLPLAAHCGVHTAFTIAVVFAYTLNLPLTIAMAVMDFVIHFTMDRIKASPDMLGRYKALSANEYKQIWNDISETATLAKKSNVKFWWALGFDQMVHHLTDLAIVFIIFWY